MARSLALLACCGLAVGPAAAYQCYSDVHLGPVTAAAHKGIAIDDSTLRWCSSRIPRAWPNAGGTAMTSLRLFKAWNPYWEEEGRAAAWQHLKDFVTATQSQVLIGTPVSCSEADDDMYWAWTKELMQLLGPSHVMGLAIGNELELLQFKGGSVTPECVRRIWDGGYFWRRFTQTVAELDGMGFASVPVTSAFSGMALGGNPFYELAEKALVKTFLRNATERYGHRFAFTFNFYPYFDPNYRLDSGTSDQCQGALAHANCWDTHCSTPFQTGYARSKMKQLTGRTDDILWVGETGWSSPMSESLTTDMKKCAAWSSEETFRSFYRGFLRWDLQIGASSVRPPDHVFWFTMRDSINFGAGEHFGLIGTCTEPKCKLHSEGYEAARYSLHRELGKAFCRDPPLSEGFSNGPKDCRDRCTLDARCRYYSLWQSNWCRLTASCDSTGPDGQHKIWIYRRLEEARVPFAAVDGGANRACRGASATDNDPAYWRLFPETASLADCKAHCASLAPCKGIEYQAAGRRCEVWMREGGIGATAPASGYVCLRAMQFAAVDGGEGRACRGASDDDNNPAYWTLFPDTPSLAACKTHCTSAVACKGIEYQASGRRCEVWTREAGIGATIQAAGYTCLRYEPRGR